MQPPQVITIEERKLIEQYAIATREYADAVVELARRMGAVSKEECNRLHANVGRTRDRSEEICAAFEQLASAHGCGRG